MPQMQGVHTALVTPFLDGQLDLPAFKALCRRQVAAGVQGVVVAGTTGESPTLDASEWEALIEATLEVCAGRVLVTAGTGTNDTRSTIRRTTRAKELGVDAALVVQPYYNKPNGEGHRAHYEATAAVGLPVVAYHIPGRTGQRLAPDLLLAIASIPGVVALKEASGDLALANPLLAAARVPLLSGDDPTFLPFCALGGSGVISVLSNVAPRATVAIWQALGRGDLQAAREQHFRLLPLMDWLFHTTNPLPCKAVLAAGGFCANEARLPLVPVRGPVPPSVLALLERDA
jgi:4-hydroxy-tetrahydrodipicolinate synthase